VTDVFLSHSSKDRGGKQEDGAVRPDRVSPVVKLLEDQGFDVFWDQTVPAGVNWDKWIRQKLKDAKCAVVLWSKYSIESENVAHEATIAQKAAKLISVLIDPLEADQFPMGLYTQQALQLTDWSAEDETDTRWQKVLSEVEAKLAPHAPLWFQRAIHGIQAELAAERARVKTAESRAKQIEKGVAKSAQSVLAAERDRDAAMEEAATLKTQLKESESAKIQEAEAALASIKIELDDSRRQLQDAKGELDGLGQKLRNAERELDLAKAELARRRPVGPVTRGGTLYAVIAGAIAFISLFCLSEALGSAPAIMPFLPFLALGLPMETAIAGAAGAFVLTLIMLLVRRRQLGASELAFYWFALMAPLGIALCAAIAGWLTSSYLWENARALFAGFLAGWLLLVASAWFFSIRRGPGLTGPAIAIYWLGICVPWLWLPVANFAYFDVFGLPPFYIRPVSGEDYSGYVIALVLLAASGIFIARRWPRRSPGMVHPQQASSGSLAVGVFWLLGMIVVTLALMALFTTNAWDWVGAATYAPEIGAFATGALVAMLIVLGSAAMLGNKRAPLDDGEVRLYWLGSAASVILFLGSFFAAKEVNWVGAASSFVGGAWSGAIFALAGWAIFFAIRRYREG
jgi:hypothetical protein